MQPAGLSSFRISPQTGVPFISITTVSKNLQNQPITNPASLRSPLPVSGLAQRIALNQLTTIRWSLEEDLAAYKQWEIPAIGVSWRKLVEHGVQNGIRKIRRSGMPVSNIGWVGGFTGQNGFRFKDTVLEAKRAIRTAGQLRAPTVTVVTGPQNRHIGSHARRLVCSGLRELADLAASYDVCVALQPMHSIYQRNWTFLHSFDETLELAERVDHPALKVAFGTYHLGHEEDIAQKIASAVDLIGIVHLADRTDEPIHENDREIPGEGALPIREIVNTLESAGYDGWYEIEVWSQELWKMDHHDLVERCLKAQSALFSC